MLNRPTELMYSFPAEQLHLFHPPDEEVALREMLVGQYQIKSLLGRGAWGVVYRARDLRLERDVALKILNGPLGQNDTAYIWALKEARLGSALSHSCICTIYDVGEENGVSYIVMEYVKGSSLSSLLTTSGLPASLTTHLGRLIASALSHAHGYGIIHRDLKASNVMINNQGRPKILDFGLGKRFRTGDTQNIARLPSSGLEAHGPVGTLPYCAPELLHGERATVSSDIWSLGILLHEMATGQFPFGGRTVFELTFNIMTDRRVPAAKQIPSRLASVIHGCLQKEVHRRYRRMRDVFLALDVRGLPELRTCWQRYKMSQQAPFHDDGRKPAEMAAAAAA